MSVLERVIGWLAPPDCVGCGAEGASLCESCLEANIVPFGERCYNCGALSPLARSCKRCRAGSPRHVIIATDYDGVAQQLIQAYKFKHFRTAVREIATIMTNSAQPYINGAFANLDYVIVPVPTATARVRERSFDHCSLLARTLADNLGFKSMPCLRRVGQSRQVGARRSDRIKQLQKAFYISNPQKITGRNILLVDDVLTTGATIREATSVLRKAGAKRVDALVFAKRI